MKYRIVIERTSIHEAYVDAKSEDDAKSLALHGLKQEEIVLDLSVGTTHFRVIRAHPSTGKIL